MTQDVSKTTPFDPGAIIAGKYRIEKQIGKGGMGRILAAEHIQLQERVALKFLVAPEDRAEEFQERFLREARVTAKLRGSHVARTLDFGVTDDGHPFIVMEYLEGVNLRQLLRESGPLPVQVAINYALQACEGLAEAHRLEVVHRDLKPANLFLTKHLDGGDLLKILDFGVSKLRNFAAMQSDLTEAGAILGSPKYMSVEQLAQAGDVDERADIWSLGTIVYEMLAGHAPFEGKNTAAVCVAIMHGDEPPPISEVRDDVPEALEKVVHRCLRRNLDERIPNVAVLARELVQAAGIAGLEPAAQAVEDVLNQQALSSTSTGQVRAFGQSGAYAGGASGRHPAARSGDSSSSKSKGSGASAGTADVVTMEPAPGGKGRSLLFAAAALLVVGAGAAYFLTRGEPDQPVATHDREVVTPASAATAPPPTQSAASPSEPEAGVDAGGDVRDAGRDAQVDAGKKVATRPPPRRWYPPPKPPPKPDPTPKSPPTSTKKADPFNSRY